MGREQRPQVQLVENLEYKQLPLLLLDCEERRGEHIKTDITYRYSCMKARYAYLEKKLKDITSIIKLKSPSLLLQVQSGRGSQNKQIRHKFR